MTDQIDDAGFDLASAKYWRGLRPGMMRSEVKALTTAAAVKPSEDADSWVMIPEWGLELWFTDDEDGLLQQLALDDAKCLWAGKPVLNVPLHEALAAMNQAIGGTGWRSEDAVDEPLEDLSPPRSGVHSDAALLSGGTVWIPERCLGMTLCEGIVNEIVWRRSEDIPKHTLGPVTDAQIQTSQRPDLRDYLRSWDVIHGKFGSSKRTRTPAQWALMLVLVVALAFVGKKGLAEMKLWQQAPVLPATLVSIETPPGSPNKQLYHVEYQDPTGRLQVATLERADFYVPPTEPGAETQICYGDGEPARVKGPARAHDAAFLRYGPWAMGVIALYVAAQTLLQFVEWRKAQQAEKVEGEVEEKAVVI